MSLRRFLTVAPVATLAVLLLGASASAHIDPDPTEAQAGSVVSVGFTVEHGCDGSPTVQLDMRLPDGVTSPSPEPLDGWTGSIDSNIVTFVGGPLPDDQALTFRVTVTLPPTPDTSIYFPFVQRCEEGEIRWIQVPTGGGSSTELGQPAPAMQLFGPLATSVPQASAPTTATASTAPPVTSSAVPTTTTSSTSTSTIPTTTLPSTDTAQAGGSAPTALATQPDVDVDGVGDDEVGSTGTVVFVGVIVAVGVVAALAVAQARRRR